MRHLKKQLVVVSILIASSTAAFADMVPPAFTVTFDDSIQKVLNQDPNNPAVSIRYFYNEQDGYNTDSAEQTTLSSMTPGQPPYNYVEAANNLIHPLIWSFDGLTNIDVTVQPNSSQLPQLYCKSVPIDPTIQYSHVGITIAYNETEEVCEIHLNTQQ